jgi:hypothetical protein
MNVTLDVCGGHSHNDVDGTPLGYHYHSQVINETGDAVSQGGNGKQYYGYVFGVHQCWKGNITEANFFVTTDTSTGLNGLAARSDADDLRPCCGSTDYYTASGYYLPDRPTAKPTAAPSFVPSRNPTAEPTARPSNVPTASPTRNPTAKPTARPSNVPTASPTRNPTAKPTARPSNVPTASPTRNPTLFPTARPSNVPTKAPTKSPQSSPAKPSAKPTAAPTV